MVAHDEALLSICFKTADMLMKKQGIYNREEAGRVRPVARRRPYRQRTQDGEEIKKAFSAGIHNAIYYPKNYKYG